MHTIALLFVIAFQDTSSFEKHEAMVPMRDGVKLHTAWYAPRNPNGPLPIIFSRTPYGIEHADRAFGSYFEALVRDESTDAYDTIEWMVHNIPNNNGRVGMLGISYDGWTTGEALIDPHPALRAASPQASPDDMFLNDDFHHQGAFRLSYGFE